MQGDGDRQTLDKPLFATSKTPRKALHEHELVGGRGQRNSCEGQGTEEAEGEEKPSRTYRES